MVVSAADLVAGSSNQPTTHPPTHPTTTRTQAWFRDRKLNRMQHSEGKLRELLESFQHHAKRPDNDRHDFRAPRKPFKKL